MLTQMVLLLEGLIFFLTVVSYIVSIVFTWLLIPFLNVCNDHGHHVLFLSLWCVWFLIAAMVGWCAVLSFVLMFQCFHGLRCICCKTKLSDIACEQRVRNLGRDAGDSKNICSWKWFKTIFSLTGIGLFIIILVGVYAINFGRGRHGRRLDDCDNNTAILYTWVAFGGFLAASALTMVMEIAKTDKAKQDEQDTEEEIELINKSKEQQIIVF